MTETSNGNELGGVCKFKTIYADPPWPEIGGGKIQRGANRHYTLMTVKDIMALPVKSLAQDNAHLYLWTTANYFESALDCVNEWGFRYIRPYVWIKSDVLNRIDLRTLTIQLNNPGLGQYVRGVCEFCIFAVKGTLPYRITKEGKRAQAIDVIFAPRGEHSRKPEKMRENIELVSHEPYVELFARARLDELQIMERGNWSFWGNESEQDVALHENKWYLVEK